MGLCLNIITLDLRNLSIIDVVSTGVHPPQILIGHSLLKEGESPLYLPREAAPDPKMAEPSTKCLSLQPTLVNWSQAHWGKC